VLRKGKASVSSALSSVAQGDFAMRRMALVTLIALLALSAAPASAQHVINNPGWCAQFYPNANCQNLDPGNPYTS
jgi:hypothetical protein